MVQSTTLLTYKAIHGCVNWWFEVTFLNCFVFWFGLAGLFFFHISISNSSLTLLLPYCFHQEGARFPTLSLQTWRLIELQNAFFRCCHHPAFSNFLKIQKEYFSINIEAEYIWVEMYCLFPKQLCNIIFWILTCLKIHNQFIIS